MLPLDQRESGPEQREEVRLVCDELGCFAPPRQRRYHGREFPFFLDDGNGAA